MFVVKRFGDFAYQIEVKIHEILNFYGNESVKIEAYKIDDSYIPVFQENVEKYR